MKKHYEPLYEEVNLIHTPVSLSWPVSQRVHKIFVPTFCTFPGSMSFFLLLLLNKHVCQIGNVYPLSFYLQTFSGDLVLLLDSIALWWLIVLCLSVNLDLAWACIPGYPKSLVFYTFCHSVPRRDSFWRRYANLFLYENSEMCR